MQLPPPRRTAPLGRILIALVFAVFAAPSLATTGADLSDRILIDGLTADWEEDESLFQTIPETGALEEPISDSEWGFNNDLNQIRLTWDAQYLYVGVDAIIWDNNVIILFDYKPLGMDSMTSLNSWRRNFSFQGLLPDLFLATWDGNILPQVWEVTDAVFNPETQQQDFTVTQIADTTLNTVASFSQGSLGRAMEAAIPWSVLLGDDPSVEGDEPDSAFSAALGESTFVLPDGMEAIRVVGVVTAGPDGTGGPDSAPDNLSGHVTDSSVEVLIDNWVKIPLDQDADGFVDLGANVADRRSFRARPPIVSLRLEISDVLFDSGSIISPEQGGSLDFTVELSPPVPPEDDFRTVFMRAEIFNLKGRLVRTLYFADARSAVDPSVSLFFPDVNRDSWDGRDDDGQLVPGGIYVLRVVSSPPDSRFTKAFTVVR